MKNEKLLKSSMESDAMECADIIREDCGGSCNNVNPEDLKWMIMEYKDEFGDYGPEFDELVQKYLSPQYDDYEGVGLYASKALVSSLINFPEMEEQLGREITEDEKDDMENYLKVLLRKSPNDYENQLVILIAKVLKVPLPLAKVLFNIGFSRYKGLKKVEGDKKSFWGQLFPSKK